MRSPAARHDRRPAPPRNTSAAIAIASATRGSSRTPTQCSDAQQQHGDHRQHRDLVRERTDRRDVVQRGDDRDRDGEQVGADHQRARDDADARAERLGWRPRRHPRPSGSGARSPGVRARRRRRRSPPPARTRAPGRRPGRRGSPGRSRPTSRGRRTRPPRPAPGPGSRRRGRRVGPARSRVRGWPPGGSSAICGGRSFHPSPRRRNWMTGNPEFAPRNNRSDAPGGNFELPTRPKHAFHLKARPASGKLQTLNAQRSRDVARHLMRRRVPSTFASTT